MNVCCVSVVGKSVSLMVLSFQNAHIIKNNPLYLRVFQTLEEEPPLKFHYMAHTALDIIEEKGSQLMI